MKSLFRILMSIIIMIATMVFVSCEKEIPMLQQENPEIVLSENSALKSVGSFPYIFDGEIDDEVTIENSITMSYDGTTTNTADGSGSAKFVKAGSGKIVLYMGPQEEAVGDITWYYFMKALSSTNVGGFYVSREGSTSMGRSVGSTVSVGTSWAEYSINVKDAIDYLVTNSGWSYDDNWVLLITPPGYNTYWLDDVDFTLQTETPTILGTRVAVGIQPYEFCASDTYDEYLWGISGAGTFVFPSSSPYDSQCEWAGSTLGSFVLSLQVKNDEEEWSDPAYKTVLRRF